MKTLESSKTYFYLEEILGEGLNSCVYAAIRKDASQTINHKVAVKILKSENSVDFWRQEVESLLKVDSSYCVKVLDFEWLDGKPALILEWVDGLTMAQLLQHCDLDSSLLREICVQAQEGLIHLHQAGLCHGDLHMNNLMVSNTGQIKLLDFGTANVNRSKSQGNPQSMAPEVIAGQPPDFWSDLYSLGSVLKNFSLDFSTECLLSPREERDLVPGGSKAKDRKALADKVQWAQNKLRTIQKSRTVALCPHPSRPTFWRNLVLIALSSCVIPNASGLRESILESCVVKVRTKKWVQIDEKYAPADLKSPKCAPLTLKWRAQSRKGTTTIYFDSQHVRYITDLDLGL